MTVQLNAADEHLRRGRRRHRGRRPRRRADEGAGQAHRTGPRCVGGLGGFAGLFRLDLRSTRSRCWPPPPTASAPSSRSRRRSTGTTRSASTWSRWSSTTSSWSAPSRCSCTDYIATGKVVPEKIAAIVAGIAEGCVQAGCALVGGETAEHPGLMGPDEYDVVRHRRRAWSNADAVLGPERVRAGDVLIALGSSGLHSNGYSLVRHVLLEHGGARAWTRRRRARRTHARRGAARRRPGSTPRTASPWPPSAGAHAFAHITGGGLRRQPGAGAAGRPRGGRRPRHAGRRSRSSTSSPRTGQVAARADGADVQPRRRHGRRRAGRARATEALQLLRSARSHGVGAGSGVLRRRRRQEPAAGRGISRWALLRGRWRLVNRLAKSGQQSGGLERHKLTGCVAGRLPAVAVQSSSSSSTLVVDDGMCRRSPGERRVLAAAHRSQ